MSWRIGPLNGRDRPMAQAAVATKAVNFRTFKTYIEDRERNERKAISLIEEDGIAAALERCRMLAAQIDAELSRKKPEQLKLRLLAEFQVSLERAASVLKSK
jgi:hypothetical protein